MCIRDRYAAALSRLFKKRLVFWVQDIVLAAGLSVVSPRGARVLAAAARIEKAAFGRADRCIVCSPGFRSHLAGLGVDESRVQTIYNWADTDWIRATEPAGNQLVRFLYAGNLGYTQGLETLLEAARLNDNRVRVEVVGAGNAANDIRRLAATVPNVSVRGPVARVDYPALLASADVHVVIQRKVGAGANLPSKIATALASGRPIVASLDLATPAAELLRESGAAILVEPESPRDLADAMEELAGDSLRRLQLGRCARDYAVHHLSKEPALRHLRAALLP